MRYKLVRSLYTIRGSCPLFVCRYCMTKYGWEHQEWCDYYTLTKPSCSDCRYYDPRAEECDHPSMKKGGFAV